MPTRRTAGRPRQTRMNVWRKEKRRRDTSTCAKATKTAPTTLSKKVKKVHYPSDRKVELKPQNLVASDQENNKENEEGKLRDVVSKLREVLRTSTPPESVCCRNSEQSQIRNFLAASLENKHGDSLYICGSPGTGKSLCVGKVCREVLAANSSLNVNLVEINAMTLARPQEIYSEILREIQPSIRCSNAIEAARELRTEFLENHKRFTVCVIDEIDALLTRSQTVLYQLFDWPKKYGSSVVLIGISNNIDLTDRFLPRLRARSCEPKLLVFRPYTHTELSDIVRARFESVLPRRIAATTNKKAEDDDSDDDEDDEKDEEEESFFDDRALQFCARKVSAVSGDVRKCMDICRQCLDQVIAEEQDENSDGGKVTISIMARVLSGSMGSEYVSRIKALPIQEKMLLTLFAFYHQIYKSKDVTIARFTKWFKGFSNGRIASRLPTLKSCNPSHPQFIDLITGLSENGLVSVTRAKLMSKRRVRLICKISDIKFAAQDMKHIRSVFDELEG
eukprot:jgi/Bigna1/142783/aug1.73_g17491